MEAPRLVDRLIRLGLTTYEARAYVALIRRDSYTAAQVARQAGLRGSGSTTCWARSSRRASRRPGRAPSSSTQRSHPSSRSSACCRPAGEASPTSSSTARDLERADPGFEAGQAHTDPLEYIEVLRDRGAINERFGELQAKVKREILVFTKPPYAKPPQENVEGIEVTRTHEARSVYEASVFDDPAATEGVRRFIEAGEEARFVDALPLKLVIIDETIVMFGMEDPVAGTSDADDRRGRAPVAGAGPQDSRSTPSGIAGLTFDQAYDRFVTRKTQTA